ncbi:MAG: DMT family transporter [Chloroflexota bacterium]|nr:DMT family transporter [Chloroflexota bacterium]
MYAILALITTVLTSLLPIFNKQLLRDAHPALVAWAINVFSLPLLVVGTFLLTQCRFTPFSCTMQLPHIDNIFILALLASVALNWGATLLSTYALEKADASLVSPLLTFNPAFTLLIAWLAIGETPGLRESIGVAVILCGAYLLEVKEARTGLLTPLHVLVRQPGALLAIIASAMWGITTVFEKLAIEHMTPQSGSFVALTGTVLMVALLTPGVFFASRRTRTPEQKRGWYGLHTHPHALLLAVLIAGIAPLFGFTAIALGLVGYVTALFKLGAVFTILWAWLFLGEGNIRQRLLGASVMVVGGALIAI